MAMETSCNQLANGKHNLKQKDYEKPYTCNGCNEVGFGRRNRCKNCDFEFHEACTLIETRTISHEFFPGSTLRFQLTPPKLPSSEYRTSCDACRNVIQGFVFHCGEDNIDLHPCCRNLKKSYQIDDVKFNLRKMVERTCMWCKVRDRGRDKGWSYVSECGKYHVHVACVTQIALDKWNNTNNCNAAGTSLAGRLNSRRIQRRNNGGGTDKSWKVLKFIVETIVSTVIGDPTTLLASFVLDAITS